MARKVRSDHVMEMYEAILELKSVDECRDFFEDLCSPTEISAMEQRYQVADLLLQNTVYLDILNRTQASTATISRVNRMLNGGTGCLPKIIRQLKEKDRKKDTKAEGE